MREEDYNFRDQDIAEDVVIVDLPVLTSARTSRTLKNFFYTNKQSLGRISSPIGSGEYLVQYQREFQKSRFSQNIQKFKQHKEKKLQEIKLQTENKIMQQCTFQPQTNKSKTKRDLNQFLKSQWEHSKKILEKRQALKQNLQNIKKQQEHFKPKINPQKDKGCSKKSQPVYERLYGLRNKQKIQEALVTQTDQFKPSIQRKSQNLIRTIPVADLLYQDAIRRTLAKKQSVQDLNRQSRVHTRNIKNDKFAAQKFIKQYYFVLEDLGLLQQRQQFSESMFLQIFRELGFLLNEDELIPNSNSNQQDQRLSSDAYTFVKNYEANARNCCVFLLALIGIYNINPINFDQDQNKIEKEPLNLDEVQGRKIQKYFDRLFRNRLSSDVNKKANNYIDQHTYHPQVNHDSQQLAKKHREKMIQAATQIFKQDGTELILPENGQISHADLLVIYKMAQQIQHQKKRQENSSKADPQCTFQPKITPGSGGNTQRNQTPRYFDLQAGNHKSKQLYNHAKKKKENQTFNEFQMNKKQQTHKSDFSKKKQKFSESKTSKLHQKTIKSNGSSKQFIAKDIQKTIARMYEGRKKRQQVNKFLERGQILKEKKKSTTFKMQSDKQLINQITGHDQLNLKRHNQSQHYQLSQYKESRQPLLTIDVNMDDRKEQIELFQGDEKRLKDIVEAFCLKHELDEESKEQLLGMVDQQVEKVICGIEQ